MAHLNDPGSTWGMIGTDGVRAFSVLPRTHLTPTDLEVVLEYTPGQKPYGMVVERLGAPVRLQELASAQSGTWVHLGPISPDLEAILGHAALLADFIAVVTALSGEGEDFWIQEAAAPEALYGQTRFIPSAARGFAATTCVHADEIVAHRLRANAARFTFDPSLADAPQVRAVLASQSARRALLALRAGGAR